MLESELTDREYIKRILIKNCGFQENKELNEKLQAEICLDIPSVKEALIFAMYTNIYSSFLLSKERYLKLEPPESLSISHFVKEGQNVWFGAPSLPPLRIPEIPIFPFKNMITKIRDSYPQIFDGQKHLIITTNPFAESKYRRKQQESNYINILDNIEKHGKKFTDFILIQLPEATYGSKRTEFYIPEDFFEYMVGVIFRKMGFLVGEPIFPSSDDAGAYLYPGLCSYLRENGIIEKGGFFGEIFLSENFREIEKLEEIPLDENVEFVYIEAESTPSRTASPGFNEAINKKGDYHHKAFVAGPLVTDKQEDVGTISFDENGNLIFNDVKKGFISEEKRLQQILKRLIRIFLS